MTKNTIAALLAMLSLIATFNSYAHDEGRIARQDKEIQELKVRLSKIESLLGTPGDAQQAVPSGEGWKSVTNWRKLTPGMSESDVRRILGEPHQLDGGNVAFWRYENRGEVTFLDGKVRSWQEPRK